jgi:Gpi18-like mannosyltransferase
MKPGSITFTNNKIAWFLLASMAIYLLVILFASSGTYDYGDGLSHYFISRYSWQHPYLFLDDWGKPLFTILSSPFAQFGLKGISIFNILCGLFASCLTFKIAEKLDVPLPYLAIVFTCSAPIYLSVINSGLTECLFSALLMLSIFYIVNDQYYWGTIVFSFLPLVRPEFSFILPLLLLYYVIRKQFKAMLLLPLGSILFSIIGYFHYKTLLWLISQNPYSVNTKAYVDAGHGDLLAFIGEYHNIIGTAFSVLLITGLLWVTIRPVFYKKLSHPGTNFTAEIILIYGSFVSILVCHTLIWSLNIVTTLGSPRYMAGLIPFASIIVLRGLQIISLVIPQKIALVRQIVLIVFLAWFLISPYQVWYKIPFKENELQNTINRAAEWFKQSAYAKNKVYYLDPYLTVTLNVDPFNYTRRGELFSLNPRHPQHGMEKGSVLIWDAHFGAEEGRMDLDTLLNDKHLKVLSVFKPSYNIKVIGNRDFAVYIFTADSTKG